MVAPGNLFTEVKQYVQLSREIQTGLLRNPYDWDKFQHKFNATLDKISLDIMAFEKDTISKNESKVYQFKRIFEKRYRAFFLYGEFPKRVYEKPCGYAGDFKIIDDIYKNEPRTIGFDGLWDRYFQQMSACQATRDRKDNLKEFITSFARERKNTPLRIMNLASGPARELEELLREDSEVGLFANVTFDCYDFDQNAINYARQLLKNSSQVNFFQKNAMRIALKKNIHQEIPYSYDLIYSTGLFDYLDESIASRLAQNLKQLLTKDGQLLIANFTQKHNNSSAGLMEWATEWFLIYRDEEEFRRIFITAGFLPYQLKIITQQNNVIQYCFANARTIA